MAKPTHAPLAHDALAIIVGRMKAKHGAGPVNDDGPAPDYVESCMRDFAHALKAGDFALAADAFRRASREVDSEPHEEGPHESEGSAS